MNDDTNDHKEAVKRPTPDDRRQQSLRRLAMMRAAVAEGRDRDRDQADDSETIWDVLRRFWRQD